MFRKTVSLLLAYSGVFVLATSVVLYIEPEGRVAYWADWTLLGLNKNQWGDLHVTTGFLFLIAMVLHVYLNWKPILAYLKDKARAVTGRTPANIAALCITLFVFTGTLLNLPPMRQVTEFGAYLKESQAEKYGNPPYGHAELSTLERFAAFMRMDADKALAVLKAKGFKADDPKQTLRDMADANGVTPKVLFEAMKEVAAPGLPETAPEGTGKLSFAELCDQFGLKADEAAAGLTAQGLVIDPAATMKENAAKNGMSPPDLYQRLREWSQAKPKPAPTAQSETPTGAGYGRMTLGEACAASGTDVNAAVAHLKQKGVTANVDSTVKEIAQGLGMLPHELMSDLNAIK